MLSGQPFDCWSISTVSRPHGVARRSVCLGREPTSTERHVVTRNGSSLRKSARAHDSSTRRPTAPLSSFMIPFAPRTRAQNAERIGVPRNGVNRPQSGDQYSNPRTSSLPRTGPWPGPVQSSPALHRCPVSCSLGFRARQLLSSPWAAEMATANGRVGDPRSTASNGDISSGPPAGVRAHVSSSGGKTILVRYAHPRPAESTTGY